MSYRARRAAAGASNDFLQRVKREITPAQYVKALDQRVNARRKAEQSASKGNNGDTGRATK